MKKITVEMAPVAACWVTSCGYNLEKNCHAKAITVGDAQNPGCDTFFQSEEHTREARRIAGVGACKVSSCAHNEDFECAAKSINVGISSREVKCLTYSKKAA